MESVRFYNSCEHWFSWSNSDKFIIGIKRHLLQSWRSNISQWICENHHRSVPSTEIAHEHSTNQYLWHCSSSGRLRLLQPISDTNRSNHISGHSNVYSSGLFYQRVQYNLCWDRYPRHFSIHRYDLWRSGFMGGGNRSNQWRRIPVNGLLQTARLAFRCENQCHDHHINSTRNLFSLNFLQHKKMNIRVIHPWFKSERKIL